MRILFNIIRSERVKTALKIGDARHVFRCVGDYSRHGSSPNEKARRPKLKNPKKLLHASTGRLSEPARLQRDRDFRVASRAPS